MVSNDQYGGKLEFVPKINVSICNIWNNVVSFNFRFFMAGTKELHGLEEDIAAFYIDYEMEANEL